MIEIVIRELRPKVKLQKITTCLRLLLSRFQLAAVLVHSNEHFSAVCLDNEGNFKSYDDTKKEIKDIRATKAFDPQYLIYFKRK